MKAFGLIVFGVSGLAMFAFEVFWFNAWWGLGGVVAAVMIPPLAAIFPLIYLFKVGTLGIGTYVVLWLASFGGIGLATIGDRNN